MLEDVLREGLRAWRDAGLDPMEFLNAEAIYSEPTGEEQVPIVRSALR